jgi:hypothetical protein
VEPVKVKLKRDTVGVGYSPVTEETVFWWASSYNRAADSLSVCNTQDSVSISSAQTVGSHGISRRCYDSHDSLVREGFLPSRVTQCGGREEREGDEDEAGARHIGLCATGKLDDKNMWRISDEELLKACGGRTGHKAARHGLSLSGKLRRLEAQEELHRTSLHGCKKEGVELRELEL